MQQPAGMRLGEAGDAAELCNGAEIFQAFQGNDNLLKWVTGAP